MHEDLSPTRADRDVRPGRLSARMLALLAAGAALVAVTAAGCASSARPVPPAASAAAPSGYASLQEAFSSAIKEVLPSVVEIRTDSGLGSGIVFDSGGDIVTNAHVVGQATSMQVLGSSSS